jgi:phosphorylase kinase alpha/beta subunit
MNIEKGLKVIERMRLPNGAYTASLSKDYDFVWIRDVCYTVLPYLHISSDHYEKAYHALFDLFKEYEWKLTIHTEKKPVYLYEYIHARYSKELKEINQEWGHAQNDAVGVFLWGVGEGIKHGKKMIRNHEDLKIVQKLVDYLECLEYWDSKDNGMWEENMEVHASSVGACIAGLLSVKPLVNVKDEIIKHGQETLRFLLPNESQTKETDLALLSLIYPFMVVDHENAQRILNDVTGKLERKYGCIRYKNDLYYNEGREAEWCFGFPWLGLCYSNLGMHEKAKEYADKTRNIIPDNWEIPELYIGGSNVPNGNTPLAWAVSMSYILLDRMKDSEWMKITKLG